MPSEPQTLPSIGEASLYNTTHRPSTPSPTPSQDSSATASEDDNATGSSKRLSRPKIGSRKSSGTMIVPRDASNAAAVADDDDFDEGDVRAMSPRRSSEELDKLGEEARSELIAQARTLQASLQAIVERVESVKSEHEKLEGGNKFLQSYIGELMQTSKITSTGSTKLKGKGRSSK